MSRSYGDEDVNIVMPQDSSGPIDDWSVKTGRVSRTEFVVALILGVIAGTIVGTSLAWWLSQ